MTPYYWIAGMQLDSSTRIRIPWSVEVRDSFLVYMQLLYRGVPLSRARSKPLPVLQYFVKDIVLGSTTPNIITHMETAKCVMILSLVWVLRFFGKQKFSDPDLIMSR